MATGKKLAKAATMALLFAIAGLAGPGAASGAGGDSLSLPKNAEVRIGGGVNVDYSRRLARSPTGAGRLDIADLALRTARLRLEADVHPNVSALFKINLQGSPESRAVGSEILEEAILALRAVGGGDGWSFYAGKGRVPYGQDVALGMIQSYHHSANLADSLDGPIFIVEPPSVAATGVKPTPLVRRPGQVDRVFLAGTAYEWDNRWRVELAVFQPKTDEGASRLANHGAASDAGTDLGFAARWWGRPVESLTLEASAVAEHSASMGRAWMRTDLTAGAEARKNAFALSLGFDWRREPWRVFGEYQHGWDWGFTRGYAVDAWQFGLARALGRNWRIGGMAEALRLNYASRSDGWTDSFYKLALNVRYAASAGWFVLAEYGHEWTSFRRGGRTDKDAGDFIGLRVGLTF